MILSSRKLQICILLLAFSLFTPALWADGKSLTMEYCQACHYFSGTEQAGTIGPPILGMKLRFKDRKKLTTLLHDPTKILGPDTMMPPFGRNHLLTEKEINEIVDFLYTL